MSKRQIKPAKPAAESPEQQGPDESLASAAEVIFGTAESPLVLRDGRPVVVQHGRVKHVGVMLSFFNALVENLDKDDIVTLVGLIEERRTGENKLAFANVEELVSQAFSRSSLVVALFQATYSVLPTLVAALTTLSEDDFKELDLDEGAIVAMAVFQVNYSFFSRNLPQAARGFLALAAKKMVAS